MTLAPLVGSVSIRPGAGNYRSDQGKAPTPIRSLRAAGTCVPELRLLENGREDERQCGQRVGRPSGHTATLSVNSGGRFPSVTNNGRTRLAGESSRPDLNHPADRSTASTTDEIHVRGAGLSHKSFRWSAPPREERGSEPVLDGEFDPGSGRTLAACLTHASRTRSKQSQDCGRPSGERVRNT